jgi:MFS family permease
MRNYSPPSLSSSGFRFFLGGRTVSELGARITREGLPIIAVLLLHATARDLSWIAGLSYLAALLAAPLAGILADRTRRRPLLIAADLLRTAILLVLASLALAGRMAFWQLLAAFGLVTALGTLFDVADQAWLPSLVDQTQLAPANAWLSAASAVGETGGPTLMGTLIQVLGGPLTILGAALSYLASAGTLLGLRSPEAPSARPAEAEANLPAAAAAGLVALWRHPLLRPLAIAAACVSLAGGIFDALYAFFALRDLHLSPFLVGLLITGGGIGALVGSAVAPLFLRRLGLGPMAVWGLLGFGLATLLVPFAPGQPLLAFTCLLAAQLLGDLLETLFSFAETVLRQSVTPGSWLGRISGAQRLLGYILGAVGAFAGGLIAGPFAVRGALLLGALSALFGLVFILRSPLPSLAAAPAEARSFPA